MINVERNVKWRVEKTGWVIKPRRVRALPAVNFYTEVIDRPRYVVRLSGMCSWHGRGVTAGSRHNMRATLRPYFSLI